MSDKPLFLFRCARQTSVGAPKLLWPIVAAGTALGLLLSWGVLSGDQQGRVNLLYLLFLYLFLPVSSLLVSLLSLISGRGINLARLLVALPLWSQQTQALLRKNHQLQLDKYWLLMQSQAAAAAFSLASLLVFFVLLLATDINFVWRSTLLDATDLLPLLELVSLPWSFWSAAQPTLELLQATQDSRLVARGGDSGVYAGWWPFVLATQIGYSLLPRTVVLVLARYYCIVRAETDLEARLQREMQRHPVPRKTETGLAAVVNAIPAAIAINNWAGVEERILAQLKGLDFPVHPRLVAGPLASPEQQQVAEQWRQDQLVIVKAWEPPMAELMDFMEMGRGYLMPLDWDKDGLKKVRDNHLQEWRRFIHQLPGWRLYLPPQLQQQAG